MSHYLSTAQLLECVNTYFRDDKDLDLAVDYLIDAQDRLAALLAKRLDVEFCETSVDTEEITSAFGPRDVDDELPCPEQLMPDDTDSDWAGDTREKENDHE